jgi:enamine deaminase RidA (YjgF/YER057c/UK114 family)
MPSIQRTHTNARMSKIVRYGGVVYLCGQTSSGSPIEGIEAQTQEVLSRIDGLLKEAGTDRSRILSATIYLRDIADFAAMNTVWERWMPEGAAPARATVQAALASPQLRVEITVIAAEAP